MGDADAKCGATGVVETLNFHPTAQTTLGAGTYEIQVHGAVDAVNLGVGGNFLVDLSYGLWPGAVSDGGGGGAPPPSPSPTLTATGYKVKGKHKVDLSWSGATVTDVDVLRDGVLIDTTANDGFYTDNIDLQGRAAYTHQICEAGTAICSNVPTTIF